MKKYIIKTHIPQKASCYGVLTFYISIHHWPPDPESVARWPRSVCPRGPVVPWSRLAPWLGLSLAQNHCCAAPESVARGTRSVCWLGPLVPWSRLAPVWPRASSPAWLRLGVPGSRIGCSVGPFGVPAWARGPVGPGPVPRPQPGLGLGSQDPESVARWARSVCWRGPVGPWALAPCLVPSLA